MRHLTEAAKADGIDPDVVKSWEAISGKIQNSYFTKTRNGCVVVTQVHPRYSLRARRQVLVWAGDHNVAIQVREFDALTRSVWMARETERGTDRLLPRRNRKVVANLIFTVLVPLLRTLSVVAHQCNGKPVSGGERNLLSRAAVGANRRMGAIERYVKEVELQTAVRFYLYGLPMGFAVIIPLGNLFGHVWEVSAQIATSFSRLRSPVGSARSPAS